MGTRVHFPFQTTCSLNLKALTYDRGGLQCPSPLWRYWAAHWRALFTSQEAHLWKRNGGTPWALKPLKIIENPLLWKLRLERAINSKICEKCPLSVFSPIWGNDCFPPGAAEHTKIKHVYMEKWRSQAGGSRGFSVLQRGQPNGRRSDIRGRRQNAFRAAEAPLSKAPYPQILT